MGQVFVMHGVVPGAEPTRFITRFLSDNDEFARFLSGRTLVSLADALTGMGDALTVDDATRAAADACRMVRSFGQPVTLFVNPGQVESGRPYWFVLLKLVCDSFGDAGYQYDGRLYPTATLRQRVALREAIKGPVSRIPDESERAAAVIELADRWKLPQPVVPDHAKTLSLADLDALVADGVDLQNHGWSHANHLGLSGVESAAEVRRGREWLRERLGIDASTFAVPFGEPLPTPEAAAECSHWLTLTETHPPGRIQEAIWNRSDLTLYRPAPPVTEPPLNGSGSGSSRVGRAIGALPRLLRRLLRG